MSLKKNINGLMWNSVERVVHQVSSLTVNMILARLLMPADFGLIAMITVFISIADTIVHGGFRQTLIIKTKLTDVDISTSFVYNMVVSLFLYLLMVLSAPYIASFYGEPKLVQLVRVLGLVNIINAGYFVQDSLMQRDMKFKILAIRSVFSSVISGIVGIILAALGFGVWSLVFMTLSRSIVINVFLWAQRTWSLSVHFSWPSFKENFSFGSRLMLTHLSGVLFSNINSLIIGKFYSKADLGYYYQANKLKRIPIESAVGVISKTNTPLISQHKDNMKELHVVYQRSMRMAAAFVVPSVILLVLIGGDLIVLLFSDKWLPSVPIFNVIIFAGMFAPFIVTNGMSPAIMGDSKAYLRIDTVYKVLLLAVIAVAVPFGLMALIIAQAAFSLVQMTGNAFIARKYFQFGLKRQFAIYAPFFLYSGLSAIGVVLLSMFINMPLLIDLIAKVLVYATIFYFTVKFLEPTLFNKLKVAVRDYVCKRTMKRNNGVMQ